MGFKENLKAELTYSGMTVKELSTKTGIAKSCLEAYLNTRSRMPSAENAYRIAKSLNETVEYLLTGESTETINTQRRYTPLTKAILEQTSRLTEESQKYILEFVKWTAEREPKRK